MKQSRLINPAIGFFMFFLLLWSTHAGASIIEARVEHNNAYVTYSYGSTSYNWYTEYLLSNGTTENHFPFDAFCIENVIANQNMAEYTLVSPGDSPFDTTRYNQAAWIADQYYNGIWANYNKSEVQSAIWEVVFETNASFDINGGVFKISNARGVVNLTSISSILSTVSAADLAAYDFSGIKIAQIDGYQDFIIKTPAPEPATMLLLGFGLLGVAGIGRRKK
jgi:hypothetical protein